MNTTLVLLILLCIVVVLNWLYNVLLSPNRLTPQDDSSSAHVLIQNVLATEPEASINLATKNIPSRFVVVASGAALNQVKKRVPISVDFIHWLNSFRKKEAFVTKFQQNKNPAATELILFFSAGTPDALALDLPNNTDSVVIKLCVDNNGTTSVVLYSLLSGCPGWTLILVDVAAAAAQAKKRTQQALEAGPLEEQKLFQSIQERQKAAKTQEMQKIFQATYEGLSAENKEAYVEWGNVHGLEDADLASCIFLAHWACAHNDAACLELLKAGGAFFDIPDNKGYTPAHYAVENCFTECLEILRAGRANFNISENNSYTPAHYAAEDNCIECLEVLKAGGADFNIPNKKGMTPAHCAALFGSEACLKALKAGGANFNIQDKNGDAPAHLAAKSGYAGHLKTLNSFGVNLNLQNYHGSTPAHLAAEHCPAAGLRGILKTVSANHEACLQALKACGANFDIQDNNGQTAREIASKKGIKIDEL